MNAKPLVLAVLFFEFILGASAQIVGYVSVSFNTGSNLFSNPVLADGANTLSVVFTNAYVSNTNAPIPQGTTVSLWNPTNQSFGPTSVFTNGSWSVDLPVPPGNGVLVVAPSAFILGCSGTVLNPDGTFFTGLSSTLPLPPVFSGKNGVYLFGDEFPGNDVGTNIFLNILGRLPYVGEQVTSLSSTSTYLGNGDWDILPTLNPGQAAFLTVMVPPPPLLTIADINQQAIISWPLSYTGWTLQTNNNLLTGGWGNFAGPVVNNTATNPPLTGNLFFRLTHP